jgi:gas vesicle protein
VIGEVFIMIWIYLLDLIRQEKRRKERSKAVQMFAVGNFVISAVSVATGIISAPKSENNKREYWVNNAVNTVKTINSIVQNKVEMVKVFATQEVSDVIKDVHGTTEDVLKDLKDGSYRKDSSYKIAQDIIHKNAQNATSYPLD